MKCKISSWGCVYHACMSDDCQKRFMIEYADYDPGDCEKTENPLSLKENNPNHGKRKANKGLVGI